tara:strand:+ start:133 stop:480 length:348 start_codon:yes stop_codon:yes gene_type:complete
MKIIKISQILLVLILVSSCKTLSKKNQLIDNVNDNSIEKVNSDKNRMEIKFSCGEDGIKQYIDEGWEIIEEYSEEKICTWKSVPATKDCDMDKDKGCKITKPDRIGEEKIYLLEK